MAGECDRLALVGSSLSLPSTAFSSLGAVAYPTYHWCSRCRYCHRGPAQCPLHVFQLGGTSHHPARPSVAAGAGLPRGFGLYIVVATATEPLYWVAQSIADQRTSDASRATVASKSVWVRLGVVAAIYAALGGIGGWLLYLLIVPIFGPILPPRSSWWPVGARCGGAGVLPLPVRRDSRRYASAAAGSGRGHRCCHCGGVLPGGHYLGCGPGAAWASVVVYLAAGLVAVVALRRAEKTPPVSTPLAVTGQH